MPTLIGTHATRRFVRCGFRTLREAREEASKTQGRYRMEGISMSNIPESLAAMNALPDISQNDSERLREVTTNSDEERIVQIRERLAKLMTETNRSISNELYVQHVSHLLSLFDRQAAEDTSNLLRRLKDFLFDNCNHAERDRNYDWCPSCVMAFMEVVARPSDTAATTRMREACVALIEDTADALTARDSDLAIGPAMMALLSKVESLTLDQVEQEKSK